MTFSGGECMLQAEFLDEMLKKCRRNGIHTAVDTAGDVPWKSFERVLPYTDLFLYDVKMYDSEKHRKYTGVPNGRILDNLAKLFEAHAHVWVRIPVIPSVNDDDDEMKRIRDFLSHFPPHKTELLPYHAMVSISTVNSAGSAKGLPCRRKRECPSLKPCSDFELLQFGT